MAGIHFHMVIKPSRPLRWLSVRQFLSTQYGINIHFPNRHVNYYTAWQYVTKEDNNVVMSRSHPDLWNAGPPPTMAASEAAVEECGGLQQNEMEGEQDGKEGSGSARF